MRPSLQAEEILELGGGPSLRLPSIPGASRTLALAIVLVLSASVGTLVQRTGDRAPAVAAPRLPDVRPRVPVSFGEALRGVGPFLVLAEPRGATIRLSAVDLGRSMRDEPRDRADEIVLGEIAGTRLEGMSSRPRGGAAAALLAYEPNDPAGAVTSLWIVRRGDALRAPAVQTNEVVEGFAVSPDGARVAVSLADATGQSDPALWVYDVARGRRERTHNLHRPGSLNRSHHIAPVAWTERGVIALPTCERCTGAVLVPTPGRTSSIAGVDRDRVAALDAAEGSLLVQARGVRRCTGTRLLCAAVPYRLVAIDLESGSARVLASVQRRSFEHVSISPRRMAYTTDALDTVAWTDRDGTHLDRFVVSGAEIRQIGWLPDERLVVVARATDLSGAGRTTVWIVTPSDARGTPVAVRAELAVVGWVG